MNDGIYINFAHSPFPLPHSRKQHRIVAKVDPLMAVRTVGDEPRRHRHLLDALLGEALAPADASERRGRIKGQRIRRKSPDTSSLAASRPLALEEMVGEKNMIRLAS